MVFKHVLMLKPFGIAHRMGKYHLPTKNIFWVTLSLDLPYEAQPVGCFQAKIRFLVRKIWFLVRCGNGNRFGAWPKGSIPIFRSLEWFWILVVFFLHPWESSHVGSWRDSYSMLWISDKLFNTFYEGMRPGYGVGLRPWADVPLFVK